MQTLNPRSSTTHDLNGVETITTRNSSVAEANGIRPELMESRSSATVLMEAWRERRFIAKVAVYGFLLAAVVSLLIPPTGPPRLTPESRRT